MSTHKIPYFYFLITEKLSTMLKITMNNALCHSTQKRNSCLDIELVSMQKGNFALNFTLSQIFN